MKRSGFTMVELIFVIVIIGILAATALPKFQDVSKNANVAAFTKIIGDIQSGAVSAYTNEKELVGTKDINLTDILNINGKGWSYIAQSSSNHITGYDYNDTINDINATVRLYNDQYTPTADANTLKVVIFAPTDANANKVAKEIKKKFDMSTTDTNTTITYDMN